MGMTIVCLMGELEERQFTETSYTIPSVIVIHASKMVVEACARPLHKVIYSAVPFVPLIPPPHSPHPINPPLPNLQFKSGS